MAPLIKRLANYTPARRLGAESEVSVAIVFLLLPAAAFISGSCLRVDGAAPNANVYHQRHAGGLDVFAGEYVGGIAAQEHDAYLPADENQGRKHREIGMMASDTAQIFFDDVRVPQRYRIGEEGMGFTYQMQHFQEERLWAACWIFKSFIFGWRNLRPKSKPCVR